MDTAQKMDSEESDDLIIEMSKTSLLNKQTPRIQDIFQVKLTYGLTSAADSNQWVNIQGKRGDRHDAKNYIKALCNPLESCEMDVPPELMPLMREKQLALEGLYNAVIIFTDNGNVRVQGCDDLSVTLAMSAIEDLLSNAGGSSKQTSLNNATSERLEKECRRLTLNKLQSRDVDDDDVIDDDDDGGDDDDDALHVDFKHMNDTVRRTYLTTMRHVTQNDKDTSRRRHSEIESKTHSIAVARTQPVVTTGVHSGSLAKSPTRTVNRTVASTSGLESGEEPTPLLPPKVFQSPRRMTPSHSTPVRPLSAANDLNDINSSNALVATEIRRAEYDNQMDTFGLGSQLNDLSLPYTPDFPSLSTADISDIERSCRRVQENDVTVQQSLSNIGRVKVTVEEPRPVRAHNTVSDRKPTSAHARPTSNSRKSPSPHAQRASNKTRKSPSPHVQPASGRGKSPSSLAQPASGSRNSPNRHTRPASGSRNSPSPLSRPVSASEMSAHDESDSEQAAMTAAAREHAQLKKRREDEHKDLLYASAIQANFGNTEINRVFDEKGSEMAVEDFLMCLRMNRGARPKTLGKKKGASSGSAASFPAPPTERELAKPALKPKILQQAPQLSAYCDSRLRDDELERGQCTVDQLKANNFNRQQLLRNAMRDRSPSGGSSDDGHSSSTAIVIDTSDSFNAKDVISVESSGDEDIIAIAHDKSWSKVKKGGKVSKKKAAKVVPAAPQVRRGEDCDLPALNRAVRLASPAKQVPVEPPMAQAPQIKRVSPELVPEPVTSQSLRPAPMPGVTAKPGEPRYIVIDGSNVAMAHGNHSVFSCRGIELAINWFLRRGHTQITAFVPQWRQRTVQYDSKTIKDRHLLNELEKRGHLTFTPARRVPGKAKNICCYDDRFVIELATHTGGVILSNDNYRDLWDEKSQWKNTIENSILPYSFVGDLLMIPDDPLGRDGPRLDEFLTNPKSAVPTSAYFGRAPLREPQFTNTSYQPQQQYQRQYHFGHQSVLHPAQPAVLPTPYQAKALLPTPYTNPVRYTPRTLQTSTYAHGGYVQSMRMTSANSQGATATVTQATAATGTRSAEQTQKLLKKLCDIFPNVREVERILANHPKELDIHKLTSHILDLQS